MTKWYYAIHIGFFAGLIWGSVKWIFYFFGFTTVLPAFLIEPFFKKAFMYSWQGHLTGLGAFMIFSMIAAVIYIALLQKRRGPWPGIFYGLAWWILFYLFLGPFFGMFPPFRSLNMNSLLSDACIFVLWGAFIGYSIAMEYTEERMREPRKN